MDVNASAPTADNGMNREWECTRTETLAPIDSIMQSPHDSARQWRGAPLLGMLILLQALGCNTPHPVGGSFPYVPLHSPAVPASELPPEYRMPERGGLQRVNLAALSVPVPEDYLLGTNDTIAVTVMGLAERGVARTISARIMADGTVRLPVVGPISVDKMNVADAQRAIEKAYSKAGVRNPQVGVTLGDKATFDIVITGEVANPGVYPVPRYQNDLAHALALAGGLTLFAEEVVEVHRRMSPEELTRRFASMEMEGDLEYESIPPPPQALGCPIEEVGKFVGPSGDTTVVQRIPLRGLPPSIVVGNQVIPQNELTTEDVRLNPGDVVVVPRQPDEVFFVVGPLNRTNVVNFRVSDEDRRLGNAFLLPKDRDVDVVTAVSMAGYIDPIDSPSTVTVHRSVPGSPPFLIRVDLIAARYEWTENVYVKPGDIIYLNPDSHWWLRRTFDRIVPDLLTIPYGEAMERWINPNNRGNN